MIYKKLSIFVRALGVLFLALSLIAVPSAAAHHEDEGDHVVGDGIADTPIEMDALALYTKEAKADS